MKKSIIFGVLAMFAISALGIQNVNAQNEVKVKKDADKEKTEKVQPSETKVVPSNNNGTTSKVSNLKGKMVKDNTPIKNDAQQNKESNGSEVKDQQKGGVKEATEKKDAKANEPQVRDMQKGGVKEATEKKDAKTNEPAMRTTQPKQNLDAQNQKMKPEQPDYKTKDDKQLKTMDAKVGKKLQNKDANSKQSSNLAKPKVKKEKATTKEENGNETK